MGPGDQALAPEEKPVLNPTWLPCSLATFLCLSGQICKMGTIMVPKSELS